MTGDSPVDPPFDVRPRPRVHFTAPTGWMNDPHGICWAGGQYHLFYQCVPDSLTWSPKCRWGHATSPDLVHWRHQPIALEPREDEEGCWSGTTLVQGGLPTILYTSVRPDAWNHGRIARATPDAIGAAWTSSEDGVLIDGPPDGTGVQAFRDPCVVRTGNTWTMIVGAGTADGRGLALRYASNDSLTWTYGGVLAERSSDETAGTWTGSMWECPQLFQVDDQWVLIVSVWNDDQLHHVAGAVGDFDGTSFVARRWQQLTHDSCSYAMTSFQDRHGRPCVMSWVRETADFVPASSPWVHSLSVPMLVSVTAADTIRLDPHPDLDDLRQGGSVDAGGTPGTARQIEQAAGGSDLQIELGPGSGWFRMAALDAAGAPLATVTGRADARHLEVEILGSSTRIVPRDSDRVRILLDTDLLEIFAGSGVAAIRMPGPAGDAVIEGDVHELSSAALTPAFGGR